ncbi:MAG: Cof-type HAD-IIB family hydrolase [Acutalibacteraceae bacterium]|nr:Cof-type HAD-IIB family hydrolase [Acutalibacteraceae bacterium]
MKYKLLATDLDGTLLNDNKQISGENLKAIHYAVKKGIIVVPCTGRAIQGVTKFNELLKLKIPAIAYNGGMIVDLSNNETLYHCPLLNKDAEFIIEEGIKLDTNICVWIENKLYCNKINKYTLEYSEISSVIPVKFSSFKEIAGKTITKVLWHDESNKIQSYLSSMSQIVSDDVTCCTSKPWFLEFFNSKTSKALALNKLCEIYKIEQGEIIAVGDELNDISMIEFAGLGVAMENARVEVKEKADYITLSNSENGFADMVYRFI